MAKYFLYEKFFFQILIVSHNVKLILCFFLENIFIRWTGPILFIVILFSQNYSIWYSIPFRLFCFNTVFFLSFFPLLRFYNSFSAILQFSLKGNGSVVSSDPPSREQSPIYNSTLEPPSTVYRVKQKESSVFQSLENHLNPCKSKTRWPLFTFWPKHRRCVTSGSEYEYL